MFDFDFTRDALFEPGRADRFFGATFQRYPDWLDTAFCPRKALWLSELTRLVYRHNPSVQDGPATRAQWLETVGLSERQVFEEEGSMAMLVTAEMDQEEEIAILSFRGTQALADWLSNLDSLLVPASTGGMAHKGFTEALDRLWPAIVRALDSINRPVIYTGHSLGGALATIAAARRAGRSLYTFGAPRVGNSTFNGTLAQTPWFRVVNGRDLVCQVPPALPQLGFRHGGVPVYITQAGELEIAPPNWRVVVDQWKAEWWTVPAEQRARMFLDLPKFMTDHAPINYVAALQRLTPHHQSAKGI